MRPPSQTYPIPEDMATSELQACRDRFRFLLNDSHIRDYQCPSSCVVACTPGRMGGNLHIMQTLVRKLEKKERK